MPITKPHKNPEPEIQSWNTNNLWIKSSHTDKGIINTWSKNITNFTLNIEWLIDNDELMNKYIDDKYINANTKRSHYRVYSNLIKESKNDIIKDKWSNLWKKETEQIAYIAREGTLSESRIENFVTEREIVEKRDELYTKWVKDLYNNKLNLQHLMLCLYTMQPPLRGEWFNMLIWDDKSDPPMSSKEVFVEDNYLFRKNVTDCWKILINNDKKTGIDKKKSEKSEASVNTVSDWEPIILDLDSELVQHIRGKTELLNEIINKSLKYYPRKYVLSSITISVTPLGKGFRNQMTYIFGKNVGVDILRQAYVNHIAHNLDLSYNQRIEIARYMRHSIITAEIQYKKLKKDVQENKYIS